MDTIENLVQQLPGYNCGSCGYPTCRDLASASVGKPENLKKCVVLARRNSTKTQKSSPISSACETCTAFVSATPSERRDSLGREYDFVLQTFPNEPGPRETIIPHNPMLTTKLRIKPGDIMIGRPMGMSCGCPITHCGVVMQVDTKTGVIVWCVTGPLQPRKSGFKDIGYYSAQAYEGLVVNSDIQIRIGMRYWFLPRRCMLQWRHSGLVNFASKTGDGVQVRIEGLMIG